MVYLNEREVKNQRSVMQDILISEKTDTIQNEKI